MGKKLFTFALCLFISVGAALAQTHKVSGTVKEAGTGSPIPGATVMVEGTLTGTSTDLDGKYTITAPSKGKITVSVIGFTTVTVSIDGRSTIDFSLEEDRNVLEDAVVVGYGSAKKVSSIVGTVATVKSDVVKNSPSSSALDALQGQVAGLSILSYSGVAGDNAVSMQLHGVGSLGSGTSPLYVIDGIPSSSRSVMAMNPNDIESISVLKDASATSIYGSRAANGVVYISTKSGSYNEKASVTVRSQYGVSTLADLTLYKNMMSGDELMDFWLRTGLYSPEFIQKNYIDKGYTANTKWYTKFMDLNNPQYQNDITIEGGGRKVSYMISGSQYHQKGFTAGNYFDRYTVRTNVQAHPMDWLKFGTNLSVSMDETQQNPNWGSAANGPKNYLTGGLSFLQNPLMPDTVDEKGEWFTALNTAVPSYYMEHHMDVTKRYGINGNVFAQIEPFRNFKLVSRAGVDGYVKLGDWKTTASYVAAHGGSTVAGKDSAFEYSATITNTAEYSFTVADDHHISVLAGQEGVNNFYNYFYAQSEGQSDDRQMMINYGTAATRKMSESNTESRFLSFFGHADYDFMHKYYFDATVRRDGVSRFGSHKRYANFWSVGAKWNIKKESFLADVRNINALDFKVSYGTQGNAAFSSDYPALGLIGNSGTYADVSARYVTQPANMDLSWEQQALFTVALSGRVFNMVDFDIQYYRRRTTDMLMEVPQPYTTGFTETNQNVGSMENNGIDLTLGVDILRGKDYFFRFNTTFSYNQQKITELFDGRQRWEIANTMVAYVVDSPIMFYLPLFAGIDRETGKPTWYKAGDDKDVTTRNEVTDVFDQASLSQNSGKKRYAPVNGGFSFSGAWKNLSFQADFAYVLGKYMVTNDGFFYANPVQFLGKNTIKEVSDYWTPENRDAKYPDWSKGYVMQFDDHLLSNASFCRLKNLQIGYSLPKSWLNWTNGVMKGLKVTFTGRNLLTFTKFPGIDPEMNTNLTYGVAGNSKQYLGGIEITF